MKYENMVEGVFMGRPNRFIAYATVEGQPVIAHVKNTGRCRELLVHGAKVILRKEDNPGRKTPYSLISVYKGQLLINMDSQIPNYVVEEALKANKITGIRANNVKREQRYKGSRFDLKFHNEITGKEAFMEVKGVTLEVDGLAKFPDAPTERGAKHIHHLIEAQEEGYEAYIFFLVQMAGIERFTPNRDMDPAFADALQKAGSSGVKILCFNSLVGFDSIEASEEVDIIL